MSTKSWWCDWAIISPDARAFEGEARQESDPDY
jgi:hypothetical protein